MFVFKVLVNLIKLKLINELMSNQKSLLLKLCVIWGGVKEGKKGGKIGLFMEREIWDYLIILRSNTWWINVGGKRQDGRMDVCYVYMLCVFCLVDDNNNNNTIIRDDLCILFCFAVVVVKGKKWCSNYMYI